MGEEGVASRIVGVGSLWRGIVGRELKCEAIF